MGGGRRRRYLDVKFSWTVPACGRSFYCFLGEGEETICRPQEFIGNEGGNVSGPSFEGHESIMALSLAKCSLCSGAIEFLDIKRTGSTVGFYLDAWD